jgi:hypothetical protein
MPRSSVLELRIVPPLYPENDVTAYIVVEDFGDLGRAFRETDLADANFDTMVRNIISGEYRNPLRVVAFNTVEGWSRDVSEDIANEVNTTRGRSRAGSGIGNHQHRGLHGAGGEPVQGLLAGLIEVRSPSRGGVSRLRSTSTQPAARG